MPAELRWHIPGAEEARRQRLAVWRVALAFAAVALVVSFLWPEPARFWTLASLIPALVAALWLTQWWNQRPALGAPNVWLDDAGLHWQDALGRERALAREHVTGYRLGLEPDTIRRLPALTLYVRGGYESQPLELHPPVSAEEAAPWLASRWGLSATAGPEPAEVVLPFYYEVHPEARAWHWEGDRAGLDRLADELDAVAARMAPPPVGCKPLETELIGTLREGCGLIVGVVEQPRLLEDALFAPAEFLRDLARQIRGMGPGGPAETTWERRDGEGGLWTFFLHVVDGGGA